MFSNGFDGFDSAPEYTTVLPPRPQRPFPEEIDNTPEIPWLSTPSMEEEQQEKLTVKKVASNLGRSLIPIAGIVAIIASVGYLGMQILSFYQ